MHFCLFYSVSIFFKMSQFLFFGKSYVKLISFLSTQPLQMSFFVSKNKSGEVEWKEKKSILLKIYRRIKIVTFNRHQFFWILTERNLMINENFTARYTRSKQVDKFSSCSACSGKKREDKRARRKLVNW